MLDILSRTLGVKFEWIAKRCGRLDLKHGRTNPRSSTSQIDKIDRCSAGNEVDDIGRYLLPSEPLSELVYAPALVSHFRVDPGPSRDDRRSVDVMVDFESSSKDVE